MQAFRSGVDGVSAVTRPYVPWFEAAPASGGCISPRRGCCMHSEFIISANRIRDLARGVMTRYKQVRITVNSYELIRVIKDYYESPSIIK